MLEPGCVLGGDLLCQLAYPKKTLHNSQLVITSSKIHSMKTARLRKKRDTDRSVLYSRYELCFFEFSLQGQTPLHQNFNSWKNEKDNFHMYECVCLCEHSIGSF